MKIKLFVKYISLLVLLFVADGCKEKKADTYVTKVTDLTGEEEQVLKLEYDRDGKIIKYGRAGVHQLRAFGDPAADDAEVGDLADVLFDLALEDERRGGRRLVGRDLLAFGREERRGLQRTGSHVDDEFHEAFGSDVVFAAGAEHGHHLAFRDADLQPRADVVLREGPLVEIELHERFVVFGGHFDHTTEVYRFINRR